MNTAPYEIHSNSLRAAKMFAYIPVRGKVARRPLLPGTLLNTPIQERPQPRKRAYYPFLLLCKGESFYVQSKWVDAPLRTDFLMMISRYNRQCDGYFVLIEHYYQTEEYGKRNQVEWYEVARIL